VIEPGVIIINYIYNVFVIDLCYVIQMLQLQLITAEFSHKLY